MLDINIVEKDMCPIGLGAHLLVDKWIPIILRDIALFDRRGFNELLKNNREGISSATLASRLKYMVQLNLLHVEKSDEHAQKKLYFLSEAGIVFIPILFQLASWTAERGGSVCLNRFLSFSKWFSALVTPLPLVALAD